MMGGCRYTALHGHGEYGMSDRDEAKSPQEISDIERQLNVLIEAVTDYAIYMLDANGNVRTWNTGAERIKGYSAEEIIGKNFAVFYTDEDKHAEKHLTALEAAAREGRYEAEGWRVRKDGSRFWVNALIYPIRDEGRPYGLCEGHAGYYRKTASGRCPRTSPKCRFTVPKDGGRWSTHRGCRPRLQQSSHLDPWNSRSTKST